MIDDNISTCIAVIIIIVIIYVVCQIVISDNDQQEKHQKNVLDSIKDSIYSGNNNSKSNNLYNSYTISNAQEQATEILGWSDQGCWKDNNTRTIPVMMNGKVYHTVEECIEKAKKTNADVVGLQAGGYCFIGNGDGYKRIGKSTENTCNILGSDWVNRVFTKNN
jgi:hypothetical protein